LKVKKNPKMITTKCSRYSRGAALTVGWLRQSAAICQEMSQTAHKPIAIVMKSPRIPGTIRRPFDFPEAFEDYQFTQDSIDISQLRNHMAAIEAPRQRELADQSAPAALRF
jgi:hypothetical protein